MNKINKKLLMLSALLSLMLASCSMIDEGPCRVGYIMYKYRNNIGEDATHQITKMTDFIFKKDSVLFRVDDNIVNGHRRQRPINLPDGEWIIVTYGNLNDGSKLDYTIGRTRFSDMTVRVTRPSSYGGTYAPEIVEPTTRIGDADQLYYGVVKVNVKDNAVDRNVMVEMSNVHVWLSAVVRWKQKPDLSGDLKNLHVRLEYVPVVHSFMTDLKRDAVYNIPFHTPRITEEVSSQVVKLLPTNVETELSFASYGLRWESNKAPTLRFYNGDQRLIAKDLDLNKYFNEQGINLSLTRVQFYQLLIEVHLDAVTITQFAFADWDDGGLIN